jgi:predicted dienelactone hydrolase
LLASLILIYGIWWQFNPGYAHGQSITPPDMTGITPVAAENPGERGTYEVGTLFYGSGKDKQRPEFGPDVELVTPTVDASSLLPLWAGLQGTVYWEFWGFNTDALPLNGRVWYPVGEGPFPLVLIVHGNHSMEEFSDTGYTYLGDLLASRGFITVSVDENFLNGSGTPFVGDFGGSENDARAWLLLHHVSQWRRWNRSSDNPFHEKVDLDNVALIGHSRGGEAVAIAAAFNEPSL